MPGIPTTALLMPAFTLGTLLGFAGPGNKALAADVTTQADVDNAKGSPPDSGSPVSETKESP